MLLGRTGPMQGSQEVRTGSELRIGEGGLREAGEPGVLPGTWELGFQ